MNEEVKFKHIISLGSFCSPALEIERHGFRDASYPFDWVLSKSFKEVMNLLQTEFHDYLSNNMYQCLDAPYTYVNMEKKYGLFMILIHISLSIHKLKRLRKSIDVE